MSKVSIFTVAGYFIGKGYPLSLFQTIKLCYIAYGYVAGLKGTKLFEEKFYAYKYGPSNSNLYDSLKEIHSSAPIYENMKDVHDAFIMLPNEIDKNPEYKDDNLLSEEDKNILDFVHRRYAKLDGMTLSELTHQKGTPWKQYFKEGDERHEIPFQSIQDYFKKFLAV